MAHFTMNYRHSNRRWHKQITATAGAGATDPILIDQIINNVSVAVYPVSGGTADVEVSTSPHDDVIAGTANWINWGPGDVTVATNDAALGPISGVRVTATTQNAVLEVMA